MSKIPKLSLGAIGSGGGWGLGDQYAALPPPQQQIGVPIYTVSKKGQDQSQAAEDKKYDLLGSDTESDRSATPQLQEVEEEKLGEDVVPSKSAVVGGYQAPVEDDDPTVIDHGSATNDQIPLYQNKTNSTAAPFSKSIAVSSSPPVREATSIYPSAAEKTNMSGLSPVPIPPRPKSKAPETHSVSPPSNNEGTKKQQPADTSAMQRESNPPKVPKIPSASQYSLTALQTSAGKRLSGSSTSDSNWSPCTVVSEFLLPYPARALAMVVGKELWGAMGDDPVVAFDLSGCDLQQIRAISEVTQVRSMTTVPPLEPEKGTGFGRPQRSTHSNRVVQSQVPNEEPMTLWCGLENGRISICDLFFFNEATSIKAHNERVTLLYTAPNGRVWSSSKDKNLKLWDPVSRKALKSHYIGGVTSCICAITSQKQIWSSSVSNIIHVWGYDGSEVQTSSRKISFNGNVHKMPSEVKTMQYDEKTDSVWVALEQTVDVFQPSPPGRGLHRIAALTLTASEILFLSEESRAIVIGHGGAVSSNHDHILLYDTHDAANPTLLHIGSPIDCCNPFGLHLFPKANLAAVSSKSGDDLCFSMFTTKAIPQLGSWGLGALGPTTCFPKDSSPKELMMTPKGSDDDGAKEVTPPKNTQTQQGKSHLSSDTPRTPTSNFSHHAVDSANPSRVTQEVTGHLSNLTPYNLAQQQAQKQQVGASGNQKEKKVASPLLHHQHPLVADARLLSTMTEVEKMLKQVSSVQGTSADFACVYSELLKIRCEYSSLLQPVGLQAHLQYQQQQQGNNDDEQKKLDWECQTREGIESRKILEQLRSALKYAQLQQQNLPEPAISRSGSGISLKDGVSLKPVTPSAENENGFPPCQNITSSSVFKVFKDVSALSRQTQQSHQEQLQSLNAHHQKTVDRNRAFHRGFHKLSSFLETRAMDFQFTGGGGGGTNLSPIPDINPFSTPEEINASMDKLLDLARNLLNVKSKVAIQPLDVSGVSTASGEQTKGAAHAERSPGPPQIWSPTASFAFSAGIPPAMPMHPHRSRMALIRSLVPNAIDSVNKFLSQQATITQLTNFKQRNADAPIEAVDNWNQYLLELHFFEQLCEAESIAHTCDAILTTERDGIVLADTTGTHGQQLTHMEHQLTHLITGLNMQGDAFRAAVQEGKILRSRRKNVDAKEVDGIVLAGLQQRRLGGKIFWMHLWIHYLCEGIEMAEKCLRQSQPPSSAPALPEGAEDILMTLDDWRGFITGFKRKVQELFDAARGVNTIVPFTKVDASMNEEQDAIIMASTSIISYYFRLCFVKAREVGENGEDGVEDGWTHQQHQVPNSPFPNFCRDLGLEAFFSSQTTSSSHNVLTSMPYDIFTLQRIIDSLLDETGGINPLHQKVCQVEQCLDTLCKPPTTVPTSVVPGSNFPSDQQQMAHFPVLTPPVKKFCEFRIVEKK